MPRQAQMEIPADKVSEEKAMMDLLARHIEDRAGRGQVFDWSQRDFQRLSEEIAQSTREHLSVTTLKRVLGRVEYKGVPYVHTLNTLCQFLGFPSWGQFKKIHTQGPVEPTPSQPVPAADHGQPIPVGHAGTAGEDGHIVFHKAAGSSIPGSTQGEVDEIVDPLLPSPVDSFLRTALLVLAITVIGMIGYLIYSRNTAAPGSSPEPESFTAMLTAMPTQTDSVPMRVKFTFKGPPLSADRLNVISLEPGKMDYLNADSAGTSHTEYTYTKPGYYLVKVFSNTKTLAQAPVVVPNRTWQGFFTIGKKNSEPVDLDARQGVTLSQAQARAAGADTSKGFSTQFVRYANFKASSDDFVLEADVQQLPGSGADNRLHQSLTFKIQGENQSITLVLQSNKATPLFIRVSEKVWSAATYRDSTFRGLYHRIDQPTHLRIKSASGKVTFELDGKQAFTANYVAPLGPITGIQAFFAGLGQMRNIKLYDGTGELVYTGK